MSTLALSYKTIPDGPVLRALQDLHVDVVRACTMARTTRQRQWAHESVDCLYMAIETHMPCIRGFEEPKRNVIE
jgi:hypothetical protein